MISHQSISAKARSPWTEERIAMLKELHASKASCSVIADEINKKTSSAFTRNAVIGMCRRMKLEYRGPGFHNGQHKKTKTIPRVRMPRVLASLPPKPLPSTIEANPDIQPKHISLMDLNGNACRWPYGDGPIYSFCGCDVVSGPYCVGHAAKAFEKRPAKKRVVTKVLEAA